MSKNIISESGNMSTLALARAELDRIQLNTGVRPEPWFMEYYDDYVDEYSTCSGFDWEGFKIALGSVADHYIDFHRNHLADLTIDF